MLTGNLGRGVIKVSAVSSEHQVVEAPAVVIDNQDHLKGLFDAGELNRDCVVVVRYQGPKALGMPELHKLTPFLGILQDKGFKVALVTDGRMSEPRPCNSAFQNLTCVRFWNEDSVIL